MPIDAATLRELSVRYQIDPRSIRREEREPGSVRGMAGRRARAALAEHLGLPAPLKRDEPPIRQAGSSSQEIVSCPHYPLSAPSATPSSPPSQS